MAYFPDLTPYQYTGLDKGTGIPALNIGWLTKSKPYIIGETPAEFKQKLLAFCFFEHTVYNCLGYHTCQFCASPQAPIEVQRGQKVAYLGNGEIRVIGVSAVYAAPTLVYHYVVAHGYKPPDEFIEAVLHGPPPDSDEHKALIGGLVG